MEIPFNLLILPFLGGYIFVRFFNYFRIHTLRSDKERILIRSSLAGFAALTAAWIMFFFASRALPNYSFCIPTIWREFVPFEHSGIAIAAFLIASLAWIPLNRLPGFDEEEQITRAINEDADPLEMMLKRSQDEGIAVAITMINEKVYIGRVVHPFNPATPTNNVGLLPLQSGYRDPVEKKMKLTIDYSVTMADITAELDAVAEKIASLEEKRAEYLRDDLHAKAKKLDDDIEKSKAEFDRLERTIGLFSLVIPVNQIASAHIFDSDVHAKYFSSAP